MDQPRLRPEIFLVALATILLEVSYTRIFSFKLVYYFTYVIIGLALLGLGSGGVLVALVVRLRAASAERVVGWCGLVGAVTVLLGYLVIALVQVNALELAQRAPAGDLGVLVREGGKLTLVCLALFVPFLAAGVAIAIILSTQPAAINRLYFADLIGAGLGCALVIPLITLVSPPGTVMLGGALLACAAIRERPGLATVVAVGLLAIGLRASWLPDPIPDSIKTLSPHRGNTTVFSQWSPVFRVDVLGEDLPGGKLLAHDGLWGSVLSRYSEDQVARRASYEGNLRALPFAVLDPGPRVTIIGSAGGNEIRGSILLGASKITAIELNPVTVSLIRERFADYTGRLAEHPLVDLHNAEGRSFLATLEEKSDLVWFVAPDSYAAMNAATAGAFVLSESYLYTVEMILESLATLTEDGIVCTQFGESNFEDRPHRTTRYLATAREAFRRLGIVDFERHVMVSTARGFGLTNSTILLKRAPFTGDEARRFADAVAQTRDGTVRFTALERDETIPALDVITMPEAELAGWFDRGRFAVGPITDDSPFFWHFVRFRDAFRRHEGRTLEEGLGEQLLWILLGLATVLAAIFLLLPLLVARRVWRTIPHKLAATVYFAALGMGFMFLEVTLIQRLTLFLGYPTYSLSVTLFGVLVFTGLGSLLSERLVHARERVPLLLGVLAVLVVFYAFGLGPVTSPFIAAPFSFRVGLTLVLLAPLGLCLGTFMPLGLRTVAGLTEHHEEYVAWAWAVNGFFSVVSSIASTMLAMTFGFTAIMFIALAIYAGGTAALMRIGARAG